MEVFYDKTDRSSSRYIDEDKFGTEPPFSDKIEGIILSETNNENYMKWLYKCQNLKSIFFIDYFGELPDLTPFKHLESLVINEYMEELPSYVFNKNLTSIDLYRCDSLINIDFSVIKNLKTLFISFCGVYKINNSISECKNLRMLNLSYNNIRKIPENFFDKLTQLRELIIQHNPINDLSNSIFKCRHLYNLNISNTKLGNFFHRGYDLKCFKKLRHLNMASCGVINFPPFLNYCEKLVSLDLSDNSIYTIPDWIDSLKNLGRFNIISSNVKTIPPTILNLENTEFNFYLNPLNLTPMYIKNFVENNFLMKVYSDKQNVHKSEISNSIIESIKILLNEKSGDILIL